jgi:hypothetical protein
MPAEIPYTDELGDKICALISTSPYGLSRICAENDDIPKRAWIVQRLFDTPAFAAKYARAKEAQADLFAEEIIEIADTPVEATKTTLKDGKTETVTGDAVDRSRLQVDARKWLAGKLRPKKYGDKLDIEQSGNLTVTINKPGDK